MRDTDQVIAVIGAGRMGNGIAQVFAYAGYRVHLVDVKDRSPEEGDRVLADSSDQIERNLQALATFGVLEHSEIPPIKQRIRYFCSSQFEEALQSALVVFEAVPEVLEAKEKVFGRISEVVSPEAILASTTSTFLVGTLAGYVKRPERFLNTHWLNPAYLIPLVEVSPSEVTSTDTLQGMMKLLEAVGKIPVQCAASPGFIVPRIQALAMNEAARMAEEGVASPEDIDKACRVGFGLRFAILGLLEFIDWGGGDILYYASHYLEDSLQSDRFAPPRVISENMEKGHIGIKSGQGFYDYSQTDISAYQQETIKKFVDLLSHLGLLAQPHKGIRNEV
ncbi:3-hydroxybutyryl-CoA dehydrogenase [Ammoniphilus sp. YIM 78166]|uniref:3-hydroxybutyryl-CoA dehydrogenase n=1 Tax=Ammoniphilus sp. YIM 78166 TaxID=1644106 RepID=UPI00106F4A90|nr:3-hydroxybutyryl-CoA dehydrogenase [Ammoniphilus sp. YIM 78166]